MSLQRTLRHQRGAYCEAASSGRNIDIARKAAPVTGEIVGNLQQRYVANVSTSKVSTTLIKRKSSLGNATRSESLILELSIAGTADIFTGSASAKYPPDQQVLQFGHNNVNRN